MSKPLAIVPVYIGRAAHIELLEKMLISARDPETTEGEMDILLVDDCSPFPGSKQVLESFAKKYDCDIYMKPENTGFSRSVNIGLQIAHKERRTAILVNQDIEFISKKWLKSGLDDPAGIVGARLVYPNHLIQHGGCFFSILARHWDHSFRFAPFNLQEACIRRNCVVTGALQFIKPETMDSIGYYDEGFRMAYEDVDFCIRAIFKDIEVVYNPEILAMHHETVIRGDPSSTHARAWYDESLAYLHEKYQKISLTRFCNPLDRRRLKFEDEAAKVALQAGGENSEG